MHVRCVREATRKTLHASPVAFATGRRNDSHARTTLISRLARRAQLTKRALGTFSASSLRVPFFFCCLSRARNVRRIDALLLASAFSLPTFARCWLPTRTDRLIVLKEYLRKREREYVRVAFDILLCTRVRAHAAVGA